MKIALVNTTLLASIIVACSSESSAPQNLRAGSPASNSFENDGVHLSGPGMPQSSPSTVPPQPSLIPSPLPMPPTPTPQYAPPPVISWTPVATIPTLPTGHPTNCGLLLPIGQAPVVTTSDLPDGTKMTISSSYYYENSLIVHKEEGSGSKQTNSLSQIQRGFTCNRSSEGRVVWRKRTMPAYGNSCSWSAWETAPLRSSDSSTYVKYRRIPNGDYAVAASQYSYTDTNAGTGAIMYSYFRDVDVGDMDGRLYVGKLAIGMGSEFEHAGLRKAGFDDPFGALTFACGYDWYKISQGVRTDLVAQLPFTYAGCGANTFPLGFDYFSPMVRGRIGEPDDDQICRAALMTQLNLLNN